MGPFTMSGGKISGNYTDGQGGAMYVQSDIVINGGEIYGNSAADGSGGIYNSNYNISISGNVLISIPEVQLAMCIFPEHLVDLT